MIERGEGVHEDEKTKSEKKIFKYSEYFNLKSNF